MRRGLCSLTGYARGCCHAVAELQVGAVGTHGPLVEAALVLPGRLLGVLEVDGLDARRGPGEQKELYKIKGGY